MFLLYVYSYLKFQICFVEVLYVIFLNRYLKESYRWNKNFKINYGFLYFNLGYVLLFVKVLVVYYDGVI